MSEQQTAGAVLMVRPAHFGSNAETAASNFFQHAAADGSSDAALRAQREFDSLALALAGAGVRVHRFAGQPSVALPDEVFPNNWLSLHADGVAVLYPMLAPSRRLERRRDILDSLVESCGYRIDQVVDLTGLEARGEYLEGTGSVVLDRVHRVAYACLSPRTHVNALAELARALRYEVVPFTAVDAAGRPIYHTNVVLSLGTRFAALGLLGVTTVIQLLVFPEAWPTHILWYALLLYILKHGAGRIALDHLLPGTMARA